MIIIGVSATCSSVAAPAGRDSKLSRQVAVNTITTVRSTNRDETIYVNDSSYFLGEHYHYCSKH